MSATSRAEPVSTSAGSGAALAAGVGCYVIWGFLPLVLQVLNRMGVPSWEILVHRVVWSAPTAAIFVLMARQWDDVVGVLRRPATLAWLTLSSALIATNWALFIWAVNRGRILETSLGYYINPLITMVAGALIFQERIDRLGKVAIGFALVGVAIQTAVLGHAPWVSLVLAFSFAGYGVVRKRVTVDAQTGFFVETVIAGIPALAYLLWLEAQGAGHFLAGPATTAWLVACGPITAAPLVLFAWAARRIPLSAMGFLQFIAPTMSFAIGLAQGEPFTPLRALSFAFIWIGVAVFLWGAWRRTRTVARPQSPA